MTDELRDAQAETDLDNMLGAIARDAADYFKTGKTRMRKKLANGAVVTVEIKMPVTK